jgi:hypothetical protein
MLKIDLDNLDERKFWYIVKNYKKFFQKGFCYNNKNLNKYYEFKWRSPFPICLDFSFTKNYVLSFYIKCDKICFDFFKIKENGNNYDGYTCDEFNNLVNSNTCNFYHDSRGYRFSCKKEHFFELIEQLLKLRKLQIFE